MKNRIVMGKATPVADQLAGQEKPAEATDQQWKVYLAAVKEAEASGFTNPTFGVEKTWEKPKTSHYRRS